MFHLFQLLALLVFGHALADFPLQGDFMARAKNRFIPVVGIPWWQVLSCHAIIHAGFVGIITNSVLLGCFEFGAHFIIDDLKCAKRINFNQDQALHLLCKLVWVAIAIMIIHK